MENPTDQLPSHELSLQDQLKNTLSGFIDNLLAQAGMLAETAGEILRNAVPNAVPWPQLANIKTFMQQIVQFRQQQLAPAVINPHIPRPFAFIHKDRVNPNELPNRYRLRPRF